MLEDGRGTRIIEYKELNEIVETGFSLLILERLSTQDRCDSDKFSITKKCFEKRKNQISTPITLQATRGVANGVAGVATATPENFQG